MEFLKKKFEKSGNIFSYKIENNITKNVTSFYNIKPFPNYDESDNKATILNKGNKILAKQFKDFVGFKKVLEVGCGTGQLSMYFSIEQIIKLYLDLIIESLRLVNKFAL